VVFRGEGGRFNRGIDLADFRPDQAMDIHGFNKWEKLCSRIERLGKVTVALLEGDVVGGGFQLALVCDARIASPSARFQLDELHKGFLPGMATFRLAKYVGLGRAKRLVMQSIVLSAEEARDQGIIDEVYEDLEIGLAATLASFGPTHGVAIELARRLMNESFSTNLEDALGNFLAAQHRAITQPAFQDTLKKSQRAPKIA
jgi:enoyl-CoA hydratase/carnithine racemase